MGLLVLLSLRKWTTPYLVPLFFLGLAPLLNGGGYYLVDTFITKKGDATALLRAGTPKYMILGAGLIFLATGLYLAIRLVKRLGITRQDTFLKRAALLGAGILPYFALALIYAIKNEEKDLLAALCSLPMTACVVIVIAWASQKYLKQNEASVNIEWRHAIFAVCLGVLAIVLPHLIFAG